MQYNEGAPLIGQVVQTLNDYGYRMVDICDFAYESSGSLLQIDVIFERC